MRARFSDDPGCHEARKSAREYPCEKYQVRIVARSAAIFTSENGCPGDDARRASKLFRRASSQMPSRDTLSTNHCGPSLMLNVTVTRSDSAFFSRSTADVIFTS